MKHLSKLPLPGTLLVLYSVYSTTVPVSIAHSIILFSLALLAGFDKFLVSTKIPSTEKLVSDLRAEFTDKLETQKDVYEAKLQEVIAEQSRQAIAKANSTVTSPSKKSSILF